MQQTVANNGSIFFSFNLSELPARCARFGMEPSRNRKLQPSPETHPIAGQEPKKVSQISQHTIEEIAMHYFNTMSSVRILWYTGTKRFCIIVKWEKNLKLIKLRSFWNALKIKISASFRVRKWGRARRNTWLKRTRRYPSKNYTLLAPKALTILLLANSMNLDP